MSEQEGQEKPFTIDDLKERAAHHRRRSEELSNGKSITEVNGRTVDTGDDTLVGRIEAAATSSDEEIQPDTSAAERPKNWESRVRIMKSRARTSITLDRVLNFEEKEARKELVDLISIIPDNELADAHKNEKTESQFRREFKIEAIED